MGFSNLIILAEETESLGETMSRAGLNTLMGILIVFFTLAFISIIIALEGKIFTSIDNKKAKKQAKKAAEAAPAVEAEPVVEIAPDDDEELVAVLMAAIYAFEAEAGSDVPVDGLVVRSIRRR